MTRYRTSIGLRWMDAAGRTMMQSSPQVEVAYAGCCRVDEEDLRRAVTALCLMWPLGCSTLIVHGENIDWFLVSNARPGESRQLVDAKVRVHP